MQFWQCATQHIRVQAHSTERRQTPQSGWYRAKEGVRAHVERSQLRQGTEGAPRGAKISDERHVTKFNGRNVRTVT